jgi:hypothetical protein
LILLAGFFSQIVSHARQGENNLRVKKFRSFYRPPEFLSRKHVQAMKQATGWRQNSRPKTKARMKANEFNTEI